jgi:hypothetical protein
VKNIIIKNDTCGMWDKGEVVIKKAVIVALDELSALISQKAKSQGYTEEKLEEDISKAKEEAWKSFYDR